MKTRIRRRLALLILLLAMAAGGLPSASGAFFDSIVVTGVFPMSVWIDEDRTLHMSDGGADEVRSFAAGDTVGVRVAGTGTPGPNADQLDEPRGIHITAEGDIYVADSLNDRIQRWSPGATEGVTVAGGNGRGDGADQLNEPREVFVDGTGNVFVADTRNHRVQRWAPGATEGETVAAVGLSLPTGVQVDEAGVLFVSSLGTHEVWRFEPGLPGTVVLGPAQVDAPQNVVLDPAGGLYVVDSRGMVLHLAPGATEPSVAAGGNGVGVLATQLGLALDVAVHSSGDLYIADGGAARVALWAAGLSHPDLLRVTTDPPLPSEIVVDGLPRDMWSLNWLKLPAGEHEICFTDVQGWATPPCETVTTQAGATTSHTGRFTRAAQLRVETQPAVPATIFVDGLPRNEWGVWTDIAPGSHEVCFGDTAGYLAPPCQTVDLVAGSNPTVVGSYVPGAGVEPVGHGLLRVVTDPPVPSQIEVDGIPRDTWALTWLKIAPGPHEVCFSDIEGFTTPACEEVVVAEGATSVVTGAFLQRGQLRVGVGLTPYPTTMSVDGVPRNDWGLWTHVEPGEHEVCFSEVAGYAPPCRTVDVTAGELTQFLVAWPI